MTEWATQGKRSLSRALAGRRRTTRSPFPATLVLIETSYLASMRRIVVLAALVCALGAAQPVASAPAENCDDVLASSDANGSLVLVDTAGRLVRRLTSPGDAWSDGDPSWSPDATRIAFDRTFDPNPAGIDLFVVPVAGGHATRRLFGAFAPSWSPSGDRIAVRRTDGHDFWWEIVPVKSGTRSFALPTFLNGVSWSPDGRRLALSSSTGVQIVDADGKHPRTIRRVRDAAAITWSPDGARIAFVTMQGLWVIAPNGEKARLIFHGAVKSPAWSPDGRLAFATRAAIELVDATGTPRVLERNGAAAPAWSPDGKWIAYTSAHAVYLVHPDRSGLRRLPLEGGGVSWRPCTH